MCGIAGIVRTDGRPVDRDVLARMSERLVHRGPDQAGLWTDGRGTGLAARRLAVVDPEGSPQPLASPDGSLRLVFNGEVYNYRRLRRDLAARGHTFATRGDAEVVLSLWEERGEGLLDALDGMFALALWDGRRRRLMLARDRLGQKPLYWWHGPTGLAFASEIDALLAWADAPRVPDPSALVAFLRFGYVPAPGTGFRGIRKLPPGHVLAFDAAEGRLDGPRRWWDIPRGPTEPGVPDEAWRERVRETLSEAVRPRLAADRPLGVLLSGGLDSSIVAALAAEHGEGQLRTFTVRFGERGWDESAYARAVAERYATNHTEVRVEPRCVEALEELVRRHGEPFADSSSVAVYALAREARRSIVVGLSGDGGDESFGGYPRHAALAVSERIPAALRAALARQGRRLPSAPRRGTWNAVRRFLSPLGREPLERYLAWRSIFDGDDLAALLEPPLAAEARAADPLAAWHEAIRGLEGRPVVDRAMAIDLQDYLPDDCLSKVDIASMAHGLEVRSPMLDHRVVELARSMPVELKWRPRRVQLPLGKAILREAFADRLPKTVLRRGKMGFGVPVSRWLRTDHADWMRDVLLSRRAAQRGLVRPATVERLVAQHLSRRADHGARLWTLLALELWFRAFIDR